MITPVVAGLLGTVIGAVASIAASVLTQQATNARERDHKLWERRADALEEIHRYTLACKNTRGWVMASKRLPDDWDPNRPQEPVRLLETKVALYAPVAVSDASPARSILGYGRTQSPRMGTGRRPPVQSPARCVDPAP